MTSVGGVNLITNMKAYTFFLYFFKCYRCVIFKLFPNSILSKSFKYMVKFNRKTTQNKTQKNQKKNPDKNKQTNFKNKTANTETWQYLTTKVYVLKRKRKF